MLKIGLSCSLGKWFYRSPAIHLEIGGQKKIA